MITEGAEWRQVASGMRTLRLSWPVRLLFPSLLISSLPRNAIGFSFERGHAGLGMGSLLVSGSVILGALLFKVAGLLGLLLPVWALGTTGGLMLAAYLKPFAFAKPLCSRCRLLPVIEEHEALHLAGVESDAEIWRVMRTRHSSGSLGLNGDPNICWFCPIPRRLSEH
jgi:hypothetical protein